MWKKLSVIAFGFAAFLSSCKDSSDSTPTPTPVTPVDSTVLTASYKLGSAGANLSFKAKTVEANLYTAGGYKDFELVGADTLGNEFRIQMSLRKFAPDSLITYIYQGGVSGVGTSVGTATFNNTNYTTKTVPALTPGKVIFTKFDTAKMVVEGTFYFQANGTGATSIYVTGGRFKAKIATSVLPIRLPNSYLRLYINGTKTLWEIPTGANPVASTGVGGQKFTSYSLQRIGNYTTPVEEMAMTITQASGNQDVTSTGGSRLVFYYNNNQYATGNSSDAAKMKLQVDSYINTGYASGRIIKGTIKTSGVTFATVEGNFYLRTP
jgi:hypothetical protein